MSLDDRFDVESPIYVGQVATAYPAIQRELDRKVLLKVMHAHWVKDAELVERFRREGRAIARIDHPNVVRVYDCAEIDGVPYLVIEWVDGGTLQDRLNDGPLPSSDVKQIARAILTGLAAVHDAGLLHRDLKADNILMGIDDRVRLADFSLAGFTQSVGVTGHGAIVGSPAYMAPEVVDGSPATALSDLYSLGIVLLEALTGSNPYASEDPLLSLDLVRRKPPPVLSGRSNIDPELAQLVDSLLQKNPDNRPQDATTARELLEGKSRLSVQESTRPNWLFSVGVASVLFVIALIWIFAIPHGDIGESDTNVGVVIIEPDTTRVASESPPPSDSLSPVAETAIERQVSNEVELPANPIDESISSTGSLTIIALPWASVKIDGEIVGLTPLGTLDIEAGRHLIEFSHDLYPAVTRQLELQSGAVDTIMVNLRAESSSLNVGATPWGYLWIDGDSLGMLPRTGPVWLAAGSHDIEIRHPQHQILRDRIITAAGSNYTIKYDLVTGTKIAIK